MQFGELVFLLAASTSATDRLNTTRLSTDLHQACSTVAPTAWLGCFVDGCMNDSTELGWVGGWMEAAAYIEYVVNGWTVDAIINNSRRLFGLLQTFN